MKTQNYKIPIRTYNKSFYNKMSINKRVTELIKEYTEYELSNASITAYYLSKQTGMNRNMLFNVLKGLKRSNMV